MSERHEMQGELQGRGEMAALDEGLRRYMLDVYNKVALGLLLAALVAYATATTPWLRELLFKTVAQAGAAPRVGLTFVGAMTAFAPVILLVCSGPALARPTPLRTGALYWSVVALVGASLGVLFLTFTGASVALTLAVSALAFGALSLMGYATRKDLGAFRGFLVTGLVGLVVALAANLALHSRLVEHVASLAGVLIFSGLVAYDTQRLKLNYHRLEADGVPVAVASDLGALGLFINFVNLFQFMLMAVSGQRR